MVTNVVVNVYHLAVSMGEGDLPDYIKNSNTIIGLERARNAYGKPLYNDNKCAFRCLAYHKNVTAGKDGYEELEQKTEDLYKIWNRGQPTLEDIPDFESTFQLSVDIFTLCEDGAVIPRYLSTEKTQDHMVLNLHENHLSYIINVPGYLEKYKCSACERHFDRLSNWKAHRGS